MFETLSNYDSKRVFSENLSKLIKKRGLSRPKVADKLNVPYSNIVNWTTKQAYPSIKNMDKLTKFFNVSKADLVEPHNEIPDNAIIPKGYVKIPIVGSIPCGNPNTAIQETNKFKLVPSFEPHVGYMYLRADGRSMQPAIKDKALVKIHLQHTIENKEIAAVSVNGSDATLKQVVKDDHDRIVMFHPLNPEFSNIFPSSDNECRIIGKAVAVENPL